jgi:hypothetical protein
MCVIVNRAMNIFIGEVHRFIVASVALDTPNVTFLCCRPIETAYTMNSVSYVPTVAKRVIPDRIVNEIFLVEMRIV